MLKLLVLALTTVALTVSANPQLQHNSIVGTVGPSDVLLFRDQIVAKARWLRKNTAVLNYPERGQAGGRITAIKTYDGYSNGKGGYAQIMSGGLGQNYVTMKFKSQRGKAMHFTVEIYGQK